MSSVLPSAASVERLLASEDSESRRLGAEQIVALHGTEAVRLLMRALGDGDWRVRKEAAHTAQNIDARARVIEALVKALGDSSNIGLRNAAVEALIGLSSEVVAPVLGALKELDADGRKLVVEVLGQIPDPRSTNALAATLEHDSDCNVRTAAAEGLARASVADDDARAAAIASLVRALSSELVLKMAALDTLRALGAELPWSVLEPLVRDPVLRRHALGAVTPSPEPGAIAALTDALLDRSDAVVRQALVVLADCVDADPRGTLAGQVRDAILQTDGATERLRSIALHEEAMRTRGAAILLIGVVRSSEDIPLLVDALAIDELAERAEKALRMLGRDVVGQLVAAGMSAAPNARGASLSLVPRLSARVEADVVENIRDGLYAPAPDVVAATLRVMATAGSATDLPVVASLVVAPDMRVAAAAQSALLELGVRFPDAARALLDGTSIPSSQRGPARGAHGRDALPPAALSVLVEALAVAGRWAREKDIALVSATLARGSVAAERASINALATVATCERKRIAGASRPAVASVSAPASPTDDDHDDEGEFPSLESVETAAVEAASFALADEERDVVLAAIRALGQLGRADLLLTLLSSTHEPLLVGAALRALGSADAARGLAAATPLVRSADSAIASAALEAVGGFETAGRQDVLFAALEHLDSGVVRIALSEIGRSLDARAVARLGLCLDHPSREVRSLAAELLGGGGGQVARALLRARLEREKDTTVREALNEALTGRHADPVG